MSIRLLVVLGDAPAPNQPGNLRRWLFGDPDWDGSPIVWQVRSRAVGSGQQGSPLSPFYFRRLMLDIAAQADTLFTYTTVYSSGTIKGPYAQQLAAGYPPNMVTADLDVTARNAYYELCGLGLVRIRGHQWEGRKKPLRSTNI